MALSNALSFQGSSISLTMKVIEPTTLRSSLSSTSSAQIYHSRLPSKRSYWSYRCNKPYSYFHSCKYGALYPRLVRYRSCNEVPNKSEAASGLPAHDLRACSSWGKQRGTRQSGKDESKGLKEDMDDEFERLFKKLCRAYDSSFKQVSNSLGEDPVRYRELIQRLMETDPYKALFGWSEARGVWNPWAVRWQRKDYWEDWLKADDVSGQPTGKPAPTVQPGARQTKPAGEGQDAGAFEDGLLQNSVKSKQTDLEQEVWVYDPITQRRVQRPSSKSKSQDEGGNNPQPSVKPPVTPTASSARGNIPVKKFVPTNPMTDLGKEEVDALTSKSKPKEQRIAGFASQSWLLREGFQSASTAAKEPGADMGKSLAHQEPAKPLSSASKIQSSLDRLASKPKTLKYSGEENKTEDVDLLRASDVRASFGRFKSTEPPKSTDDIAKRRQDLENHFNASHSRFDKEFADVKQSIIRDKLSSKTGPSKSTTDTKAAPIINTINPVGQIDPSTIPKEAWNLNSNHHHSDPLGGDEFVNQMQSIENQYSEQQRQFCEAKKRFEDVKKKVIDHVLQREVQAQKSAMDGFESKPREHQSESDGNASPPAVPGPKALHQGIPRSRVTDAHEVDSKKSEQKKRDIALVQEVRSIYEDTYGIIDTHHRQPRLKLPSDTTNNVDSDASPSNVDRASQSSSMPLSQDSKKNTTGEKAQLPGGNGGRSPPPRANQIEEAPFIKKVVQGSQGHHNHQGKTREKPKAKHPSDSEAKLAIPWKSRETPKRAAGRSLPFDVKPKHPQPPIRRVFKVLTYDPAKQTVAVAKTTSSLYEESSPPRSPSSILTHLDNPARYFDHMESLEADGYELVAGSRRMLVYARAEEEQTSTAAPEAKVRNDKPQHAEPKPARQSEDGPTKGNSPTSTFQSTLGSDHRAHPAVDSAKLEQSLKAQSDQSITTEAPVMEHPPSASPEDQQFDKNQVRLQKEELINCKRQMRALEKQLRQQKSLLSKSAAQLQQSKVSLESATQAKKKSKAWQNVGRVVRKVRTMIFVGGVVTIGVYLIGLIQGSSLA